MTVPLTINGQVYPFPVTGDRNWGAAVTSWATAVTTGMLQKAGGSFVLLAEVDFGATYGLKSAYYKSRATTIASAGVLRLANTDTIAWRNNADSDNNTLTSNASDALVYNGTTLAFNVLTTTGDMIYSSSGSTAARLAIGSANTVLTSSGSAPSWAQIVNANVSASAAIAYSKLTLTGSIVNADVSASAAIAYSKLNLTGSIVNADINSSAAIAYSKLNLSASIVNADIASAAAIAVNKLAALTASRAVASDASGFLVASAATSTELGYLSGVTSAIQTQLNAKATNPMTTAGDIIVATTLGVPTRLAIGGTGTVLSSNGSAVSWQAAGSGDVSAGSNLTDNAIVRGDGGVKGVQTSALIIDDSNNLSGVVGLNATGTVNFGTLTASQVVVTDGSKNLASLAYASANTASALVQRDGSGNFSAGTITAALSGNATTATTASTVTTNANLTGPITSVGNATSIASQTGTGTKFVVDNTPTLITPVLGVATATSINKVAITAPATSATLTIADGKTLTASNTLTFTGTDSTSFAFPSSSDTVVTLTASQTLTNKTLTAPTMTTPILGVASATSIVFGTGTLLNAYDQGTYAPTVGLTNASGVGSNVGWYMRVGNKVTVWGYFTVTTGTTGQDCNLTLPISPGTNFSARGDAAGVMWSEGYTYAVGMFAITSDNRIQAARQVTTVNGGGMTYMFSYRIL